jgi:hypothetical protein
MKNFISKYKVYIIISVIATVILISTQSFGNKEATNEVAPTPSGQQYEVSNNSFSGQAFSIPSYSKPPENSSGKVDISSEQVKTAIENKTKLKKSLPIYIENFKTSNGMSTTLNVYTISSDPDYLIRIDIYGIDFNNQDVSKETNPNVTAFIDSFEEIKKRLTAEGVDIHNIYFILGQRKFIQETADLWIKTYGLL